ncbi:MAG: mucoidy inhibitor MuiA family protein [Bacteroidota bacterium]
MFRIAILLMGMNLLYLQVFSQEKEITLKTDIESVTVYLKGAQVERKGKINIPRGESTVVIKGLSPRLDPQSIQVRMEGNITQLSQNFRLDYEEPKDVSPEIKALSEEISSLQTKIADARRMIAVYTNEEKIILANQKLGSSQEAISVEELKAAADFFRSRLFDITREKISLEKEIKQWQLSIGELQLKKTQLGVPLKKEPSGKIVLVVQAMNSTTYDFDVRYLVKNAGWIPNYELRYNEVDEPLSLVYKAKVYQQSKEDWKDVTLTISSADPNQDNVMPLVEPWYIGYRPQPRPTSTPYSSSGASGTIGLTQPQTLQGVIRDQQGLPLPGAVVLVPGSTTGTISDENGNFSVAVPAGTSQIQVSYLGYRSQTLNANQGRFDIRLQEDNVSLEEVVITGYDDVAPESISLVPSVAGADRATIRLSGINLKKRRDRKKDKALLGIQETTDIPLQVTKEVQPTSFSFTIAQKYSIPSSGRAISVKMKTYELPAHYEHYCAPSITEEVFLTAQILDWEELNLLAGEATLYQGLNFLGTTLLDPAVVEDTLDISLGPDPNVVVTRTKSKDFIRRQMLSNFRKEERAWDIDVKNKKNKPIHLVIEDQIPISTQKEIEVDLKQKGGATLDETYGILTWDWMVDAKAEKKTGFRYEVRYPKTQQVYLP